MVPKGTGEVGKKQGRCSKRPGSCSQKRKRTKVFNSLKKKMGS